MNIFFYLNSKKTVLMSTIIKVTFITSLMSGCSGNYSFDSNMKADSAEQYFSANKIKVFDDETEFKSSFIYVGLVEGEDCQKAKHLAPPDAINARTQARQTAFLQKANAVIFTSCIDIDTKHCVAQIVCYGKAYRLGEPNEKLAE